MLHPIHFSILCFCFIWLIFLFPSWFLLWPVGCSGACCLISMYLQIFLFLQFISSFIPLWSEVMLDMIPISLNLLGYFCGLTYDLSWIMFQDLLRKMFTLLLLDEMFCIYLLSPCDLACCLGQCLLWTGFQHYITDDKIALKNHIE